MTDSQETLCFTCGQLSGEFPRLNCLPGGQVCPACRDRLLDCLPPCLPGEEEALEGSHGQGPREGAGDGEIEREANSGGSPRLSASKGPRQLLDPDELEDEPA